MLSHQGSNTPQKYQIIQHPPNKVGICCLNQNNMQYMIPQELVFCYFFSNFALQIQKYFQ